MDNKNTKKEKLLAYKERKIIGGVYTIKNNVSGKMLLMSTVDLRGIKNRFEFSQKTGSCINKQLEKDWNGLGGEAFSFEALEELEKAPEQTDKEFKEDVKVLEELWLAKFDTDILY